MVCFAFGSSALSVQDDPEKISVSQEYLHGLRVALDTERRRVEELEAEVCRLNKELAALRASFREDEWLFSSSYFSRWSKGFP